MLKGKTKSQLIKVEFEEEKALSNSSSDEQEALNEILYFLKIIGKNLKEVYLYKWYFIKGLRLIFYIKCNKSFSMWTFFE